ncbi:MAG TPA: hypothetical protein VLM38_13375, partial [Blastocatellia bacterium]|nr:hypothetical protein [Blastocatellia bacterium]
MRMRLAVCFFAVALFVSISAASASRLSGWSGGRSPIKTGIVYQRSSIDAGSYRSPGRLHKAVVSSDDSDTLARAVASGAVEIADYGSFKLLAMNESALHSAEEPASRVVQVSSVPAGRVGDEVSGGLNVRDDFNVLLLRSGAIDTTDGNTTGDFVGMGRAAGFFGLQSRASQVLAGPPAAEGTQLRLVQFVGPVKRAWLEQLEASGFETIAYIPNNGYLVRGDSSARARFMGLNQIAQARGEGFVQWEGPFLEEHKIHPALLDAMAAGSGSLSGERTVAVQLALGHGEHNARDNADVKQARRFASQVLVDTYGVLGFTNLRLKIETSRIASLAALPSVVNIEPWSPPQLLDERSAQIVAGQLADDSKSPVGPGYAAWLAAHGFSSTFNFAIDVSDSGLDRGAITPDKLHPD